MQNVFKTFDEVEGKVLFWGNGGASIITLYINLQAHQRTFNTHNFDFLCCIVVHLLSLIKLTTFCLVEIWSLLGQFWGIKHHTNTLYRNDTRESLCHISESFITLSSSSCSTKVFLHIYELWSRRSWGSGWCTNKPHGSMFQFEKESFVNRDEAILKMYSAMWCKWDKQTFKSQTWELLKIKALYLMYCINMLCNYL